MATANGRSGESNVDFAGADPGMSALFEAIPAALAVLDAELHVTAANSRFGQLCGTTDRPHGRSVFEVIPLAEGVLAELLAGAAREDRAGPVTLRCAEGETPVRTLSVSVFRLPASQDTGELLVVLEDVTERVERRRHLEAVNARLVREADDERRTAERRGAQLRALVGDMALVEERERRRIAHLLHDDLQQLLLGIRLNLEQILDRVPDPGVHATLVTVLDAVAQANGVARSFAAGLLPPVLHEGGLVAAVRWLGRQHQRTTGVKLWVEADPGVDEMSEAQRVVLFQAVSELLLNVAKHAHANNVEVQLRRLVGDLIQISVSDDGVGFDPRILFDERGAPTGLGLFTNRERLEALGGRMTVASGPTLGTRVTLELPLWRRLAAP
ncbi:MAG: hypothetical protein EP329_00535 [Deltaproteobacteria bacterium]|nr:MAG: hypothetical protein EP329_00535 [Deltaproteobacteria bacterium]